MLEEIYTQIGEETQAQWSRYLAANNLPPTPPVKTEITDDAVNYQGAPPRVVFVPGSEPFLGRELATPPAPGLDQVLFTRKANCSVHLWGDGRTASENLLHCFVRACYALLYGSVGITGGEWKKRSTTKLGNIYLLNMYVLIPIPRETPPERPLTSFPTTMTISRL